MSADCFSAEKRAGLLDSRRGLRAGRGQRVALDPGHHGGKTVRALGREMIVQAQLGEDGLFIGREDLPRCSSRIQGEKNGYESAHDMGIAVATEVEDRIRPLPFCVRDQPNLACAPPNLCRGGAF